MNRIFLFFFVCLILFSCSNKQKQLDNERLIQGDWVVADIISHPDSNGLTIAPYYTQGFSFYFDHNVDNKVGWSDDSYLSTITKYKIASDSLLFYNPIAKEWNSYRLIKLDAETLKFGTPQTTITFKHYKSQLTKTPKFDKIVLSTSGCFGTCPILNIIIDSTGKVIFNGRNYTTRIGFYESKISIDYYNQLQNKFRKVNFDSLENYYSTGMNHRETITTTFVKNGKIYKTISDYGRKAPFLLEWAYFPISHLYQIISLNELKLPGFIPDQLGRISIIKNSDSILLMKQSEAFLLWDYLRKGEISNKSFKPQFKLRIKYDKVNSISYVDTDGRYYTFIDKGKSVTIDIGFNFYDVNAKMWKWRKATEYD